MAPAQAGKVVLPATLLQQLASPPPDFTPALHFGVQSSDARPLVFALPLKSGGFTPLKLRWEWSETLEIVMQ